MDTPHGFVALKSLKRGGPNPPTALTEIRRIYFKTTRKTIELDLAHAIELLKSLPTEDEREKARVYMDGLSQMRTEWRVHRETGGTRGEGRSEKGDKGRGGRGKRTNKREKG